MHYNQKTPVAFHSFCLLPLLKLLKFSERCLLITMWNACSLSHMQKAVASKQGWEQRLMRTLHVCSLWGARSFWTSDQTVLFLPGGTEAASLRELGLVAVVGLQLPRGDKVIFPGWTQVWWWGRADHRNMLEKGKGALEFRKSLSKLGWRTEVLHWTGKSSFTGVLHGGWPVNKMPFSQFWGKTDSEENG